MCAETKQVNRLSIDSGGEGLFAKIVGPERTRSKEDLKKKKKYFPDRANGLRVSDVVRVSREQTASVFWRAHGLFIGPAEGECCIHYIRVRTAAAEFTVRYAFWRREINDVHPICRQTLRSGRPVWREGVGQGVVGGTPEEHEK